MQNPQTPIRHGSPNPAAYENYQQQYYPHMSQMPNMYNQNLQSPFSVNSQGLDGANLSSPSVSYYPMQSPQVASHSAPHIQQIPNLQPHSSPQMYPSYLPYSPQFSASQTSVVSTRSFNSPKLASANVSPSRNDSSYYMNSSPTRMRRHDGSPKRDRDLDYASHSQTSLISNNRLKQADKIHNMTSMPNMQMQPNLNNQMLNTQSVHNVATQNQAASQQMQTIQAQNTIQNQGYLQHGTPNMNNNIPMQTVTTPLLPNSQPAIPNVQVTSSSQDSPSTLNHLEMERHPEKLTQSTREKAAVTKLKIEHFFKLNVNHAIERNQRRVKTEQLIASEKGSDEWRDRQLANLGRKESAFLRLRRTKLCLEDFNTVKVIGKGAFGEVRLVQKLDSGQVFAMKTLYKSEMFKKDQLAHVKAERDVLAGSDSPWVVSLYYSFQDDDYLYLIMEFLPGGDLMTMLIKYDIFSEDITRFYIAECVLAIEAIHKLGFIHRDIKPDNILIDKSGHIKLSDFGLSTGFHKTHDSSYYKQLLDKEPSKPDSIQLTISNRQQILTWRKSRRLMAYSTVGTPDYIAPEIFIRKGYSQECDWWSLGAIMFECLVGWPPFCSETPQETYRKILNWKETLSFPDDIHLSPESEDLIRRLLTSQENRLGRGGADEIKQHPFFRGVDWSQIREYSAPFVPRLNSIMDTSYFPIEDLQQVPEKPRESNKQPSKNKNAKEDLPFIGYTFSRFDYLTKKNAI